MRDFAVVQIEEVGCGIVGFEDSQILGAKMRIRLLALEDREEER